MTRRSPRYGENLLAWSRHTTTRDNGCLDRVRSQKQAQRRRAEALGRLGKTWGEVADVFRDEYGVNARVALRLAHGWSQGDAADRWNERWPDDLKTFKNISYWERWPAASGYTPSLDVLTKLAQLYECHVAEAAGRRDNRSSDPVYRARRDLRRLPAVIAPTSTDGASAEVGGGAHPDPGRPRRPPRSGRRPGSGPAETMLWSAQLGAAIDRRTLLLKLGLALTVAAAAPDGEAAATARRAASAGEAAKSSASGAASTPTTAPGGRTSSPTCTTSWSASRTAPLDREPAAVERVRGDDASDRRRADRDGHMGGADVPDRLLQGRGVQGSHSATPLAVRKTDERPVDRIREELPDQQRRLGTESGVAVPVPAQPLRYEAKL